MIMNIEQDQYLGDMTDAAGIRLVVHPQTRMPFPEDEGISIGPGRLTSVGLKMVSAFPAFRHMHTCKLVHKHGHIKIAHKITHANTPEGCSYTQFNRGIRPKQPQHRENLTKTNSSTQGTFPQRQ